MGNKYNQYYRQQKSNANPVNNPEDENKQNPENTPADNEQQLNGVVNSDNENQQNPDDNSAEVIVKGHVDKCLKLNIRKEPSPQADILCEVPVNTKLLIAPDTSTEEWFSVVTESGVNGFCMAKYVNV